MKRLIDYRHSYTRLKPGENEIRLLRQSSQGLFFSLGPAVLAGLIMVPQMSFMHPLMLDGKLPAAGMFALNLGWRGPVGIVVGHLIYGAVMGGLYVKPVGYPVGRRIVPYG